MTVCPQCPQPRRPEATVADKPVNQHTPTAPGRQQAASSWSGTALERNGCRQQNTRGAIRLSASQARTSCPKGGAPSGSARLTRQTSTNSAARISAWPSRIKPAPSRARTSLDGQSQTAHARAAASSARVVSCCRRARARQRSQASAMLRPVKRWASPAPAGSRCRRWTTAGWHQCWSGTAIRHGPTGCRSASARRRAG